jgi:hypothetical protein
MELTAMAAALGDLATALVFGGMAVFSFLVAPAAFRALGLADAAKLMGALFPVYYRVMAIASAVAAVAFAVAGRPEEWALAGVALGFVGLLYLLRAALDAARALREAGKPEGERRFARLHRLSVGINLLQFLVVLGAMTGVL